MIGPHRANAYPFNTPAVTGLGFGKPAEPGGVRWVGMSQSNADAGRFITTAAAGPRSFSRSILASLAAAKYGP